MVLDVIETRIIYLLHESKKDRCGFFARVCVMDSLC